MPVCEGLSGAQGVPAEPALGYWAFVVEDRICSLRTWGGVFLLSQFIILHFPHNFLISFKIV